MRDVGNGSDRVAQDEVGRGELLVHVDSETHLHQPFNQPVLHKVFAHLVAEREVLEGLRDMLAKCRHLALKVGEEFVAALVQTERKRLQAIVLQHQVAVLV